MQVAIKDGRNLFKYSICQRNRAAGSKIWYLRTFDTVTKKITFESLGTEKKTEAVELLAQRQAERFKTPEQRQAEKLPSIVEAVGCWLDFVSRGNAGTFRVYSNKIPYFLDYCKKNNIEKITDFSTQHAAALIEGLPKENKPGTVLNKKRVYSNLFTWIYTRYDIEKINPFSRVKTQKVARAEKEFWTVEEIGLILDNAGSASERLLFAFMAFAGLRYFEAEGLFWENIEGGKLSIVGKGSKAARVPIGERLEAEIERYITENDGERSGRIFSGFSNNGENLHLKAICQKLGMSGAAHCHKFRHSFASNLLRAGGSIIAVSKLMRHEKPDITLRVYSHCLPDDLEKTLNLL